MWRPLLIILYILLLGFAELSLRNREVSPPYTNDIAGVSVGIHPGVRVWQNAQNLWQTKSLKRNEFAAIGSLLQEQSKSAEADKPVWQDLYAISTSGEYYPKHQHLITYLGALSYAVFGEYGAWMLNLIALSVLLVTLYFLSCQFASPNSTLLIIILLPWIEKHWIRNSISTKDELAFDLIGSTILIGGFAICKRLPLLGGTLLGLSLHLRLTWVVYVVLPLLARGIATTRQFVLWTIGVITSFVAILGYNYYLFGDPLRGPYARLPEYSAGMMRFDTTSHTFSLAFLWELRERLFSTDDGCFIGAPYMLITILLLCLKDIPPMLRRICITAIVVAAPHFIYGYWIGSGGTRFVLPSTLLMSLPLAWAVDRFLGNPTVVPE